MTLHSVQIFESYFPKSFLTGLWCYALFFMIPFFAMLSSAIEDGAQAFLLQFMPLHSVQIFESCFPKNFSLDYVAMHCSFGLSPLLCCHLQLRMGLRLFPLTLMIASYEEALLEDGYCLFPPCCMEDGVLSFPSLLLFAWRMGLRPFLFLRLNLWKTFLLPSCFKILEQFWTFRSVTDVQFGVIFEQFFWIGRVGFGVQRVQLLAWMNWVWNAESDGLWAGYWA